MQREFKLVMPDGQVRSFSSERACKKAFLELGINEQAKSAMYQEIGGQWLRIYAWKDR